MILGLTMAAAPLEMILSRFIGLARRLFPPVVTGSVVMLIGMSLIKVGMMDLAGGFGAPDFGSARNLVLGAFVMITIILLYRFGRGLLWTVSIGAGLVAGYILSSFLGLVDFSAVADARWISFPRPLVYGLDFEWAYLLPWLIGYFVTTIESIGDLTATSAVSRQPVTGPLFLRRLEGGVLADGFGSLLAGFFNSMPNTTFSQNNGLIGLTGVASRRVGIVVAVILALLGLFPKFGALVSIMPKPVLGGATLVMFAMVATAGLSIVARAGLGPRNQFILAVTLALGLGVTLAPESMATLGRPEFWPAWMQGWAPSIQIIFQSGLALGAIVATGLNLLLPSESPEAGTR